MTVHDRALGSQDLGLDDELSKCIMRVFMTVMTKTEEDGGGEQGHGSKKKCAYV